MPSVDALISQNITNATINQQNWGGIHYNAKVYEAKGDNTTDDYAKLSSLITTTIAGAEATILFPPGTYRIGTNLTFPSNIKLRFEKGAKLSPDSGKTITINGTIEAGLYQIFAGSGTITGDMKLKEVYPQWWGASGSSQTTTGSTTAGSTTLTLTSALDFQNGQGIAVNHAGAAVTLTTPGAPTVTPTGTPGSTSYQYQIVALTANGGCTAAGTAGSTTTGNATLSATNYNALSWTAVTGASGYAVYGRISGTMQLLAVVTDTSYNDKGGAAITAPYLPSTPPTSSLANALVTTIASGAGTTILTLGASATTTVSGQTVYHDDTTAIQNAINAAFDNGRKPVWCPDKGYNISNKLQLTKGAAASDPVSLIGIATEAVTLKAGIGFPANTPMAEVFGGSGGVTKAVVQNMVIDGNNIPGIIGINNRGVGGFRAVDCTFINMKYGFRLSNTDGGNFTEFSYAENCWFQITVEIPIHYYRTSASAGAKSFHGSGILGGIINVNPSGAGIKLQDDSGAGDAIVYNSPIHCNIFENGTFISTNSTISMRTYGIIRIESTGITLGVGAGGINHCGTVQTINSAPTYGTFNLNGFKETSGLLEANFYNARLRGTSGLKFLDDAHPTWVGYDGGGTSTGTLCYCWNAYYDGGWKGYKTGKRCLIISMNPTTGDFKIAVAAAPASDGGAISVNVVGGISAAGALMVGNSANATTLGSVVKKMEVFDANGNSLGFVPIYNSIT